MSENDDGPDILLTEPRAQKAQHASREGEERRQTKRARTSSQSDATRPEGPPRDAEPRTPWASLAEAGVRDTDDRRQKFREEKIMTDALNAMKDAGEIERKRAALAEARDGMQAEVQGGMMLGGGSRMLGSGNDLDQGSFTIMVSALRVGVR